MVRVVEDKGSYSVKVHSFLVRDERRVSYMYVTLSESKIIINGYLMRGGLVTLVIDYDEPTMRDVKKILSMEPIEVLAEYGPKIKVDLIIPQLHNYIKMYSYGGMDFVLFEYADGYVIIDQTAYRVGLGVPPLFNDDVFDLVVIIYNTKEVSTLDVIYAIDEHGKVSLFYGLL